MPSLSLLKRLPRDPPESPRNCQSPEIVGGGDDNGVGSAGSGQPSSATPGRERRNSKREFLLDLIGRSRLIGRSPSSPPPAGSAASSSSTPLRGRSGSAHLAGAAVRFPPFLSPDCATSTPPPLPSLACPPPQPIAPLQRTSHTRERPLPLSPTSCSVQHATPGDPCH